MTHRCINATKTHRKPSSQYGNKTGEHQADQGDGSAAEILQVYKTEALSLSLRAYMKEQGRRAWWHILIILVTGVGRQEGPWGSLDSSSRDLESSM